MNNQNDKNDIKITDILTDEGKLHKRYFSDGREVLYDENERPILIKESTNNFTTYNITTVNPDSGQILDFYEYFPWNYNNSSGFFLSNKTTWTYSENPCYLLRKSYDNNYTIYYKYIKISSDITRIIFYTHSFSKENETNISKIIDLKRSYFKSPNNHYSNTVIVVDKVFQLDQDFPNKKIYLKKYYYDEFGKLVKVKYKNKNIILKLLTYLLIPLYNIGKYMRIIESEFCDLSFWVMYKNGKLNDIESKFQNCWEDSEFDFNNSKYKNYKDDVTFYHPIVEKTKKISTKYTFINDEYFKDYIWSEFKKYK